jgi:hypothetical protein
MGKVIRVTLRFRSCFWETICPDKNNGKTLSRMNYLFTQDDWFPTWWTRMPDKMPVVTGWAPAHSAERLSQESALCGRAGSAFACLCAEHQAKQI